MDLKRLRYFTTVARSGSFTAAAESLHMAQPPLSQRIQELEAEIGAPLLNREQRPLTLTAAGQLFYKQAVQILQQADEMMVSMRRMVNNERPTFTFGLVPANFHGNLSAIIRQFRQALPRLDIRMVEMNSVEQAAALSEGRIDAGISRIEIPVEGIRRIVLRHEPMIAALPFDHPLATLEEGMTLEALKDEPFLVYSSKLGPSVADLVLSQVQARGIELSNVIEVDQYDTALIMIAAGCGVSIVPSAARLVAAPGVAYRPLAEAFTCPIVLCHRQSDTSHELQTLYFVLSQFLSERGHLVPVELQDDIAQLR
jgi:DNA-binding transcriptional LysR family regulator